MSYSCSIVFCTNRIDIEHGYCIPCIDHVNRLLAELNQLVPLRNASSALTSQPSKHRASEYACGISDSGAPLPSCHHRSGGNEINSQNGVYSGRGLLLNSASQMSSVQNPTAFSGDQSVSSVSENLYPRPSTPPLPASKRSRYS
jgi:hypothetical protein